VLAICAVSAVVPARVKIPAVHVQSSNRTKDAIQFIEGIAFGFDSDFANATKCVDSETTVMDDFDQAFELISQGIGDWSRTDIEQGLMYFAKGVISLSNLTKECGLFEIAADLESIAQKIAEGPVGWLELIIDEILDIFSHRKDLGYDFRQAKDAWIKGDFYTSGTFVGQILGIIIQN